MRKNRWIGTVSIGCLALAGMGASAARSEDSAWVSIIPPTAALEGWTPKFSGKAVGQNPDTTFRLSPEGYLWANNHTAFSRTSFGHLYYTKRKFSYYMVRAEYRFTAEKSASGFETWTNQNNGLMIHSPEPATVSGDFPNSIEVQLLGPKNTNGSNVEPSTDWPVGKTGNMCIAGDKFTVNYNGNANYTSHCTPATYPNAWKGTRTPWEGEWSEIYVRVLADSSVAHIIRGQKVFESTKIRLTAGMTPVKEGYLAIQAEGTSTLFRKLEILELTGCMDNTKSAYRTYFVKNDAAACNVTGLRDRDGRGLPEARDFELVREGGSLIVRGTGAFITQVRGLDGASAPGFASGRGMTAYAPRRSGIYLVSIRTPSGSAQRTVALF